MKARSSIDSRFVSLALALALVGACGENQGRLDGSTTPLDDAGMEIVDDAGMIVAAPDLTTMRPGAPDLSAPIGPPVPLTVLPANATLPVDGVHSNGMHFQALRNGVDVTASTSFSVSNGALGSFNGSLFTSTPTASGTLQVNAAHSADQGSTGLTLKVTSQVIAAGAPVDAPTHFGGAADASKAPKIVYPADGVLIPANLNILEVHFLPAGNDLFEIGFAGNGVGLKVYTACGTPVGGGCVYQFDEPTWGLLSSGARNQTITMTIRGTLKAGGSVGTSATQKLSFSAEDLLGGLYYWAAASGGIYRYDFGLRGQKAESFYTPQQAGGVMCVGCHALARNGSRISVGLNIPGPSTMRILDVAQRKQLYQLGTVGGFPGEGSNYEALSPDGAKIVTTEKGGLTLRDAANGTLIGANPAVANANMPDWSADGSKIAFARGASNGCNFGICNNLGVSGGGIFSVAIAGNAFGATTTIVPSGTGNNFYPSWTPDGAYVVYNHSSDMSYDAPDAHVMAASAKGGGAAIDLVTLNGGVANSWPKVAPYTHHLSGAGIFWVTFSSRRPYGLRGNTMTQDKNGNPVPEPQIWMAAVDVNKLAAGQDGSYPSFWLPFQDFKTGNHIPQWVEKIERAPCSQIDQSGCMQGEMCVNGVCQPGIQ